jgi:hypothetical protein
VQETKGIKHHTFPHLALVECMTQLGTPAECPCRTSPCLSHKNKYHNTPLHTVLASCTPCVFHEYMEPLHWLHAGSSRYKTEPVYIRDIPHLLTWLWPDVRPNRTRQLNALAEQNLKHISTKYA